MIYYVLQIAMLLILILSFTSSTRNDSSNFNQLVIDSLFITQNTATQMLGKQLPPIACFVSVTVINWW